MVAGFREHASGLIVPEEMARARQVMPWQEWRDLEKVTKALAARGIVLQLKCTDPRCQKAPIQRHRTLEGGISFRCEHQDLTYTRTF